jgi:aryl-alcohol dehydrogenase-like predicted oxidoreductase
MSSIQPHLRPRRELGRTGFTATRLGVGDLADRSLSIADCAATLHHALSYGLNLVETAPSYENGYSEEIVGAALKGRRDGVFVIDKIDHWDEPIAPQVDGSLRRLQMEHADLFVFHGLSSVEEWDQLMHPGGAMEQLDRCLRAGKARFKGLSSHDPITLKAALQSGLRDVVLFPVGPHVDANYV